MKIIYYGHSCFALISKNGTPIMTDPYTQVGYELPSGLAADAITVSHGHFDHNYTQAIQSDVIISTVGAHTVNERGIVGIDSYHDPKQGQLRGKNIIFKYLIDGMNVCHFGDLGEEISRELIEKIGVVDVLLIPVGGKYTIDAEQAKEYIEQINPRLIIPMHYKPTDGTLDIVGPIAFLEKFNKNFLSIVNNENCITIKNGITEISADDFLDKQRVIYMERVK